MHSFDRWPYSNRLRHMYAGEKMLFAAALLAISLTFGSIWLGLIIFVLFAFVTVHVAAIPQRVFFDVCMAPISFLIISTATLLLTIAPTTSDLNGLSIGPYVIGITPGALVNVMGLFGRSLGGISALAFLMLTTPLDEMIQVIYQIGIPSYVAEVMIVMYRFIFVLADTANQIRQAQDARLGYCSLRRGYESLGSLAAMLFINAFRRGQRLQTALDARGYTGELHMLDDMPLVSTTRLAAIVVMSVMLTLLGVAIR